MVCPKNIKKLKIIIFIAVSLLLSGCGRYDPYSSPPPNSILGGKVIISGAQASFQCDNDIVTLGSANYYSADFIDEFGNWRTGFISGLWVSLKDKPETNRFFSAYSELIIYYYFLKIEILQVGGDYTEVEVSAFGQSGKTERCSGV